MDKPKKSYSHVLPQVVKNKNKDFWKIKLVQASGHGGQNINHGNSKAQLTFDINKFFEVFEIGDDKRDKFVEVFGSSRVHHESSVLILENQETRYAKANKEKVLLRLRELLSEVLKEDVERITKQIPAKSRNKRIKDKKHVSEKKKNRSKIDVGD